jgi:hypothetical protein
LAPERVTQPERVTWRGWPWVTARPTASSAMGLLSFSQTISLSLLNDKKKEEEEWERLSAGRKKWERRRNGRKKKK